MSGRFVATKHRQCESTLGSCVTSAARLQNWGHLITKHLFHMHEGKEQALDLCEWLI